MEIHGFLWKVRILIRLENSWLVRRNYWLEQYYWCDTGLARETTRTDHGSLYDSQITLIARVTELWRTELGISKAPEPSSLRALNLKVRLTIVSWAVRGSGYLLVMASIITCTLSDESKMTQRVDFVEQTKSSIGNAEPQTRPVVSKQSRFRPPSV